MKTAMQELINWIENGNETSFYVLRDKAKKLLKKEEKQMIDFAYEILEKSDEHQSGYVSIEEIYNQTYNQNK
jgi:hypothetical protein